MTPIPDEAVLKLLAYHPTYGRQLEAILSSCEDAQEPLVRTLLRLGILSRNGEARLIRSVTRPPSSILAQAVFSDSSGLHTLRSAAPRNARDILALSESVFEDLDSVDPEGEPEDESSRRLPPEMSLPDPMASVDLPARYSPTGTLIDADGNDEVELEGWSRDVIVESAVLGGLLEAGAHAGTSEAPAEYWEPSIGEEIGRWRIVKLIGRGATASVWGAEDSHLKVEVALKLLHAHHIRLAEAFLTEACMLAHLNHQHIVRVFDCGRIRGTVFVASEWIRGGSIGQILRRLGPLQPTPALEIAFFTTLALGHALRRNLIHRDVKPDNIFLNAEGEVKLGDFGLASTVAERRRSAASGGPVGSPGYLCPSWLMEGHDPDHRADIYSLGISLYQMITGHLPYVGETVSGTLKMHRTEPIPPRPDQIPATTWPIIHRMIQKDPGDRYDNYNVLAADLRTELAELGGSTVPHSMDGDYESEVLRDIALSYIRGTRF